MRMKEEKEIIINRPMARMESVSWNDNSEQIKIPTEATNDAAMDL